MTIAGNPSFGSIGAPWWDTDPVFLIGGGPSLRGFDLSRLAGRGWLCGVNQSMFMLPVHAGLSIDMRFVTTRRAELTAFAASAQLYLSLGSGWWRETDQIPGAINLRNELTPGLSLNLSVLRRGASSGYAALNLATLKRAKRVVLLGYDYANLGGAGHFHDAYTWRAVHDSNWLSWAAPFETAAETCRRMGVAVVNASPRSALECFPKLSIDDALQWAR